MCSSANTPLKQSERAIGTPTEQLIIVFVPYVLIDSRPIHVPIGSLPFAPADQASHILADEGHRNSKETQWAASRVMQEMCAIGRIRLRSLSVVNIICIASRASLCGQARSRLLVCESATYQHSTILCTSRPTSSRKKHDRMPSCLGKPC